MQVKTVADYLDQWSVSGSFRDELLDQMCCELEARIADGQSFDQAWVSTQNLWTENRIKSLNNSIRLIKLKPMIIRSVAVAAILVAALGVNMFVNRGASPSAHAEEYPPAEVQIIQPNIKDEGLAESTTKGGEETEKLAQLQENRKLEMAFMQNVIQDILMPRNSPLHGVHLTENVAGFGMRKHPITGDMTMHKGIDLVAPLGTAVYATADGVVVFAGENGDNGIQVRINHRGGFTTVYNHLQGHEDLRVGQTINIGTRIGRVGSTGASTGPHLHYEVRKNDEAIDPC
ncbi:MAG: M23 family metallopeptidase [Bacteroidota bacterium]